MTFGQAVSSAFRNYVNFEGRAARSEYWYWVLFIVIVEVAFLIVISILPLLGLLYLVFALGVLLPSIAVTVRRLHDIDKSGWWILISFIPLIGAIILIIWECTKGTLGPNRFGADPLGGSAV